MILTLCPITKELSRLAFDCGHPQLNQFLRHYAYKNDQLSIGKTFLALSDSHQLAGYLCLSSAQIGAESLPQDQRKFLPRYPVPALRISKLAVDLSYQKKGVGSYLLKQALQKTLQISQNVGIYAVLVDAIDPRAQSFYIKYGFIPFHHNPLCLFLPIKTIEEATRR